MTIDKRALGLLLLRLGLGGVFLWFGVDKFISPLNWIGWIPGWLSPLLPMSQYTFIYTLGVIEVITGVLVLVGYYTRIAAVVAGLQLLGIIISFGFNDIMIRDMGLLFLAASIVLLGAGTFSLDRPSL